MAEPAQLWIFAYGSLMWRPDFPFAERHRAALSGFHRALCIWSHLYRGTVERPGLVFGLDRGGSCLGVAFRVAPDASEATLEAVRCRELVTDVYRETRVPVDLADGRRVEAITYVADPAHPQYACRLSLEETVRTVGGGHGTSGSNVDYVRNTHAHLQDLGVDDPLLNDVWAAIATWRGAAQKIGMPPATVINAPQMELPSSDASIIEGGATSTDCPGRP